MYPRVCHRKPLLDSTIEVLICLLVHILVPKRKCLTPFLSTFLNISVPEECSKSLDEFTNCSFGKTPNAIYSHSLPFKVNAQSLMTIDKTDFINHLVNPTSTGWNVNCSLLVVYFMHLKSSLFKACFSDFFS